MMRSIRSGIGILQEAAQAQSARRAYMREVIAILDAFCDASANHADLLDAAQAEVYAAGKSGSDPLAVATHIGPMCAALRDGMAAWMQRNDLDWPGALQIRAVAMAGVAECDELAVGMDGGDHSHPSSGVSVSGGSPQLTPPGGNWI